MKSAVLLILISSLTMSGCFTDPMNEDDQEKSAQKLHVLWDYAYDYDGGAPFVVPTKIDNKYVLTSGDTKVTSVRVEDGAEVWKTPFDYHGQLTNQNFGIIDNIIVGTINNRFLAWDKLTGEALWATTVHDSLSWSWSNGLTRVNKSLIHPGGSRELFEISADGELTVHILDVGTYETRYVNGILYMGQIKEGAGLISAIEMNTMSLKWRFEPGEFSVPARMAPIVENGVVYIGTVYAVEGQKNAFFALNAATGEEIWRHEDILTFHAILEGDYIYINDGAGIVKLRKSDGGLEWYTNFDAGAGTAPIAYGYGYIYAPHSGYMFIVDADSGKIVHGLNPPHGSFFWLVTTGAGRIFAQSNRHLYAFAPWGHEEALE